MDFLHIQTYLSQYYFKQGWKQWCPDVIEAPHVCLRLKLWVSEFLYRSLCKLMLFVWFMPQLTKASL